MLSAALAQGPETPICQPRSQFKFALGQARLSATLFGDADGDWSSSLLARPAEESLPYRNRIGTVLTYLKAGRTYVPSIPASFNAKIVERSYLGDSVYCIEAGGHMLYRNPQQPGEGVVLDPGEAVFLTPAGCGTAVLTRGHHCVVCHFGRWSLFDRNLIEYGTPNHRRRHESIVYAALEALEVESEQHARDVRAALFWSVRGKDFPHPMSNSPYAPINTKLQAYVHKHFGPAKARVQDGVFEFDPAQIFRAQLLKMGVTQKNIDDDYRYLPKTGTWQDGGEGKPRNAVFIVRHS